MARPPSAAKSPLISWLRETKADAGLRESDRAHYLSMGRQLWRECSDGGVVHQACAVGFLVVYRRMRERPPDAITAGRLLGELIRSARALGLLLKVGHRARPAGKGAAGGFNPPVKPAPLPPDLQDDDTDDNAPEAAQEEG